MLIVLDGGFYHKLFITGVAPITLDSTTSGFYIASELTEKFNAEIEFWETKLISMLFYLGYLTIKEKGFCKCKFQIPNDVIREIYSKYFF